MPTIRNGDATLYFEVHGKGFPILTFAPLGLESNIPVWDLDLSPIKPVPEWSGEFQVIVMDQRNSPGERSFAPIRDTDNWDTFTSDHVAILDHLGIGKCHLFGQCVGGPFILNFLRLHPGRVQAAIIAQPSGRIGPQTARRKPRYQAWVDGLKNHPEATDEVLDALSRNLYGPEFVASVDRAFCKTVKTPILLMAGNDDAHPRVVSDELSQLLPDVQYIPEWKAGAALQSAREHAIAFLRKHTPR